MVFEKGAYIPLQTQGAKKDHIIAFARSYKHNWVVALVPRFVSGLIQEDQSLSRAPWEDTRIILPPEAPRFWKQVLTGEQESFDREIRASSVFKESPVILYLSKEVS